MKVENGKKVTFDYVLTIEGQKVDSSENGTPLEYVHGEGTIIRGLSAALEGMTVRERKTVTISPEDGYGVVNQEAYKEVPKTQLPAGFEAQVGSMLQLTNDKGQVFPVMISEIRDESVLLDFNHPLAGKELQFDVTIIDIQ